MNDLLPEERETHLNMTGDDHGQWVVFTDDPYWIRRLDKVATATKAVGNGYEYTLDANQVTIRAKPKELSAEEKERRASRMRQLRAENSIDLLNSGDQN